MEVSIREAEIEDIPIIVRFLRGMLEEMTLTGGHAASKDEAEWGRIEGTIAQEVKKKDHLYLLAERAAPNLAPIGFAEARIVSRASVFEPKRVLHIHALYVDEVHRRGGAGQALLEATLGWGRGSGCQEAELSVLVGNSARALYGKLCFRPFEVEMVCKL